MNSILCFSRLIVLIKQEKLFFDVEMGRNIRICIYALSVCNYRIRSMDLKESTFC